MAAILLTALAVTTASTAPTPPAALATAVPGASVRGAYAVPECPRRDNPEGGQLGMALRVYKAFAKVRVTRALPPNRAIRKKLALMQQIQFLAESATMSGRSACVTGALYITALVQEEAASFLANVPPPPGEPPEFADAYRDTYGAMAARYRSSATKSLGACLDHAEKRDFQDVVVEACKKAREGKWTPFKKLWRP